MPEDGEWETAVAGGGNHFLVQFFFLRSSNFVHGDHL